jgi:hypothetical protein
MEKLQLQSKEVKRLFSKLQTTPQKSKLALLLEEWYDIPLAIARVISRNIRLDAPKVTI